MEKVIMFDTTMRDGRQCPGAGLSDAAYIAYIRLADRVGFDIIEAGFPSSSQGEYDQVRDVASMAGSGDILAQIAGLCQLRSEQVERTIRSLEPAVSTQKAFLHTYIPVDPRLLEASMGKVDQSKEIDNVARAVSLGVNAGMTVQFSPEGYSRMGDYFDWCTDLIRAAVASGARYINCPDTIGGASRYEGALYYVENMRRHKAIIDREFPDNQVIWSVHNHNDLGNAVDNSISGVVDGVARKIEGTIGGIGERAGNADLLQIVMNMRQFHSGKYDTNHIDISGFHEIGTFVGEHMLPIQPHYPIVGGNAYRHTSGGHVNAVLKNPGVYHPFSPESVGGSVSLLFGPQSGGNHARDIVKKAGITFVGNAPEFAQFLKTRYSDRRKGISDAEVIAGYADYMEISPNLSTPA